jgi:hypothetical protein
MGWGAVIDRVTSWLPIQKPVERLKNEKAKLEEERNSLLGGSPDVKKSNRINSIDKRVAELNRLLQNKANDN